MEFLTALMLGALQGLTEFLPVSSSGHLALAEALLPEEALSTPGILFEVVVHLGTLAAALLWLRREVGTLGRSLGPSGSVEGRKLLLRIAAASVPAVLVGLAVAGIIRTHFADPGFAGFGLLLTGALLLAFGRKQDAEEADAETDSGELPRLPGGFRDALLIGTAQAVALFPGVSRSGATIVAGKLLGLTARDAARFSFLLSAPVILGAALLETTHAFRNAPLGGSDPHFIELGAGFAAAFVFGWIALRLVFTALTRARFHAFGWYCLAAGGTGIGLASG